MQVVVLYLIKQLPKPLKGSGYYVFLNNLFVSTRFVKYTCSQGIIATRICRIDSSINQELLDLKQKDKKDIIL